MSQLPELDLLKLMMTHIRIVLLLLLSFSARGAGYITELSVVNKHAVFSTTQSKTHPIPSCVAGNYQQHWSISIDTKEGAAIYSMLMMASASGLPIGVESAGDCAAAPGNERAARVWITSD